MPVTLQEVARRAGVSKATASIVLRGGSGQCLTPATRKRVAQAKPVLAEPAQANVPSVV